MDQIIQYLLARYDPESVILYGSYADGSNNAASDFDALVITSCADHKRDTSLINGIQLDVFLFSPEEILCPRDFPQLYDCRILLDKHGSASQLCSNVRAYIDGLPGKSAEEIETNLVWCKKMLLRTDRGDTEGFFRWHWLLCDSLEIYCDIRRWFYFGPKKTLHRMEREDSAAFAVYGDALSCLEKEKLAKWVTYLGTIAHQEG